MRHRIAVVLVTALSFLSGGGVYAQDMHNMPGMKMPSQPNTNGSAHAMAGTVTALDNRTGMLEVNSEGMTLRLHFPPAALAGVKVGDKIQIGLSFKKL